MNLFLALDTSFEQGSLGVFRIKSKPLQTGPEVLSYRSWSAGQRKPGAASPVTHSNQVILKMRAALKEAGVSLPRLDFVSVSAGPGRFTGLRCAVNTARSLAFALKKPCYPVNSLQVAAEDFLHGDSSVAAAFNGFKNSVYFAEFSAAGEELISPRALPFSAFLEQIKNKALCVGDVPRFYELPRDIQRACRFKSAAPSAKSLAQITAGKFNPKNLVSWRKLEPLYLREDTAQANFSVKARRP